VATFDTATVDISTSPWGDGSSPFATTLNAAISLQDRAMPMNDEFIAPDIGMMADLRHMPADQMYAV
jgi:hypothetical protein